MLIIAAGSIALAAATTAAPAAETCFRACLKTKMTESDIDDQGIRDLMRECRDGCQEDAETRLIAAGLGEKRAARRTQ